MPVLECLLVDVDLLDPVGVVHLRIDLALSAYIGVDASEVGGAPHLVGVELVWAPELVPVPRARIVHAVKQRVSRLETKLAVEIVPVSIAHKVEPIV